MSDICTLALQALDAELDWLANCIAWRFQHYFGDGTAAAELPAPPALVGSDAPLAALLQQHQATPAERLALALALAPHLRPQLLDIFFTRNQSFDKPFAEFGGQPGDALASHSGHFTPTGETLAFVSGGAALAPRLDALALLAPGHWLAGVDLLRLGPVEPGMPLLRGALLLPHEALGLLATGVAAQPALGSAFPARPLRSALHWDDLVLHPGTQAQLHDIRVWLQHGHTLRHAWGMAPRLRPGLRALFHGPPGTGKTLTAALLGQAAGRDVWAVDLSLVVSKYIGETEKNLARVFDVAQQRGWLLFFDEADALFGKRSDTRDAHDRYANQEVAWLLQRIESFDGIVVLASNQKDNIDPAFSRRFEAVVHFPPPRPDERLRLWQHSLPAAVVLEPDVALADLAVRHALSGAEIVNCVRHACLQALEAGSTRLSAAMLQRAVQRELAKDGRAA